MQPTSPRQVRAPHQELVDRAGALAALPDGPDDEGLAAPRVAGSEDLADGGGVVAVGRLDIAALVELDAERFDGALVDGMDEAHGEQHEIGLDVELAAGHLAHGLAAAFARDPFDAHGVETGNAPILAGEGLGRHGEIALAAFLMRARGA